MWNDNSHRIVRQGEVEQHLESGTLYQFSGRALTTLGALQIENADASLSQDIDERKIKRAARKSLALANGENSARIVHADESSKEGGEHDEG